MQQSLCLSAFVCMVKGVEGVPPRNMNYLNVLSLTTVVISFEVNSKHAGDSYRYSFS